MFDSAQKVLQQRQIKDRLSDGILAACPNLEFKAANLLVNVGNAGVRAHPYDEACTLPDRVAADVEPAIQIVYDVHQANRIHIENSGCVGIIPHLRRITGDADQVADPRGCRAQQIGLNAQNVTVAAGVMQDCLDANFLLYKQ